MLDLEAAHALVLVDLEGIKKVIEIPDGLCTGEKRYECLWECKHDFLAILLFLSLLRNKTHKGVL